MGKLFKGQRIDDQPAANWLAIQAECARHERFVVEVRKHDELREISRQQTAYMHAVVFPALAEYVGCSELMAETLLKKKCGEQYFVHEIDGQLIIGSKTSLTVKQTTIWLENCWEWLESIGCPVPPPDPCWRLNQPPTPGRAALSVPDATPDRAPSLAESEAT